MNACWPTLLTRAPVPRRREVDPRLLVAQGRVLDAVADGFVLCGSRMELARRLGIRAVDLTAAIRELKGVGWLVSETGPGGRLAMRLADEAA